MITYITVMGLLILLLAVYSVIVYRIHRKINRIANDILRIANKLKEDLVISDGDLIDIRAEITELTNTLNIIGSDVEDSCESEVVGKSDDEADICDGADDYDDPEFDDFYDGKDYIRFKFH